MNLLPGILIGILVTSVLIILYRKLFSPAASSKQLEQSLQEMFPRILQNANQQLISMADQKLGAQNQEMKTDLMNKKIIIEDMIKRLHDELEKSNKRIEDAERERIGTFHQLKVELEKQHKITEQLSATADGLKKVLGNNQLRGHFIVTGKQVSQYDIVTRKLFPSHEVFPSHDIVTRKPFPSHDVSQSRSPPVTIS